MLTIDHSQAAPAEDFPLRYQQERLNDGVRFTLPHRRLRKAHVIGAGIVGAGLFGLTFLSCWMAIPMIAGGRLLLQGAWIGLAICAFGALALVGLGKCLKLLLLGLAVLTNRTFSEIELRDNKLQLYERFFGQRFTRKIKMPVSDFRELRVGPARHDASQTDNESIEEWLGTFASAIYAEGAAAKPVVIAACYPQSLLEDLASDIVAYLPHVSVVEVSDPVHASSSTAAATETEFRYVCQPATSDIDVEPRPDGTTYRVPAAGFVKGSKGLFTFAIVWNLFVVIFMAGFGIAMANDPPAQSVLFGLLIIPFIAVGIGVLLSAINMARRKTAIVTAGSEVFVISEGIFGKKTRTWHAADLTRVSIGPSGLSVNDVPVMELQFHSSTGKFGVLSERSNDELLWLSVQVSFQLGLLKTDHVPSKPHEPAFIPAELPHYSESL